MCYNSRAVEKEISRIVSQTVGPALREGIDKLKVRTEGVSQARSAKRRQIRTDQRLKAGIASFRQQDGAQGRG
jgi:hypothetical protein